MTTFNSNLQTGFANEINLSTSISCSDWEDILFSIGKKQCVVVIGPGVPKDRDGVTLQDSLCNLISEELKIPIPETADKQFLLGDSMIKDKSKRTKLMRLASKVYQNPEPNETYNLISQVPVKLFINLSPDDILSKAFKKNEFDHQFSYYNYKIPSQDTLNINNDVPIIYNISGCYNSDSETVCLHHKDLFEYLSKILGYSGPISPEVASLTSCAERFIFLGFDFESWYLRIIMHLLMPDEQNQAFAYPWNTEYLRYHTLEFFRNNFKIDFINNDIDQFLNELIEKCKEKNLIRKPVKTAVAEKPQNIVKKYVSGGNTDAAITFLEENYNDNKDVLMLASRFNRMKRELKFGTISFDEAKREDAMVASAILDIIDVFSN